MSVVLKTLASTYPADAPISFFSLNAEELPEVSEAYDVTAVPYIVLQKGGKVMETVSGSDASKVRAAVEKYAGAGSGQSTLPPAQTVTRPQESSDSAGKNLAGYTPSAQDPKTAPEHTAGEQQTSKEELHQRLSELVKAAPVMLFMKGTPSAPQCGFSRQTVSILREKSIRYGFFNILADDEVRQGLKEFADWPTFPQLWAEGELVGGLDIVSIQGVGMPGDVVQHTRLYRLQALTLYFASIVLTLTIDRLRKNSKMTLSSFPSTRPMRPRRLLRRV